MHRFVNQRFRHPLDPRVSPVVWYGEEHGKRQVRPAEAAIHLGGRRLEQVDAAHQVSDGGGQLRPDSMSKVPSLSQDANICRNRRVIDSAQRKTHSVKLGDSSGGKTLKQNEAAHRANWRIDLANDTPCLVGDSRHHARRAVGLEVETDRTQEIGDTNLAQCSRQSRGPVNGTQQDVFYGLNSAHGRLLSVDRMKRIHDGVSLTTDDFADCMMRAAGYLEDQGLFRHRRKDHPHVFRFAATEE